MSKSPNHYNGRNGCKPDIIVCHITEGGYGGAVSWLCNPQSKASATFVVGAKGQSEQLVDFKDTAWCNGNSIDPNSQLYYKNALNPIVRSRAVNANYYTYSIEHEGYSYKDRFGALTEPQYQASLSVMKLCIQDMKNSYGITFIPDRDHLIGHFDIDPKGKPNCPAPNQGKNFPFDRFIGDIKAWMGITTTPAPVASEEYIVVTGDTLSGIASRYKTTVTELCRINNIVDANKIYVGQRIELGQKGYYPYEVEVTASALNIRSGPSTNFKIVGSIPNKGVVTIVDEQNGDGAKKWGKTAKGYISLDYTKKI